MEAFGAAGAGVGLLGSAVSGLKELRDFIGAIQDGPYDLEMARRRLDQHAAFLPKLQAEYDTRYDACISVEERADFVRCLQDCQEDVKRYKEVLEKASKTRTRGKGLQKLEAGARMYFSEDDFKKQKSTLLDRTVQLQTFINRAHRSFTGQSLRGIESSMTQQHAENINMHSSTQSSLQDKFSLVVTQLATKEKMTLGIDSIENQCKAMAKSIEISQKQAMSMHSSMDASTTTIVRTMEGNHREVQIIQNSQQATLQGLQENMSQFLLIAQFLTARSGHGIAPLGRRSSRQRIQERVRVSDDSAETAQVPSYIWQPGAVRKHKTPFGRLYVFVDTDSDHHSREKTRTSYFIRFLPLRSFLGLSSTGNAS
ncbi:hypothetical protein BJ166DRAFT_497998 [Pestalotiopsis sp. NC0098]|nr:hypothetical protein BJ166DRAFT_497998 [Pestalotiopsis sp. NC0098]